MQYGAGPPYVLFGALFLHIFLDEHIYGLRSDIVHGRDTDKNSTIVINGTERSTKEIAIDFLRFCLLFIIQNQKYLDVSEFENALDAAIDDLPVKRVK